MCTVRTFMFWFDVRRWSRESRDPEEGPTFWVLGQGVPEKALRFWISRRPERHRSSRSSLSSANQPFHFEYLKNNKNSSKLNYHDGGWPIIQINVKIWLSKLNGGQGDYLPNTKNNTQFLNRNFSNIGGLVTKAQPKNFNINKIILIPNFFNPKKSIQSFNPNFKVPYENFWVELSF